MNKEPLWEELCAPSSDQSAGQAGDQGAGSPLQQKKVGQRGIFEISAARIIANSICGMENRHKQGSFWG